MPTIRVLRVQASRSLAQDHGAEATSFALRALLRANKAGFDVLWGPLDGARDFAPGLKRFVKQVLVGYRRKIGATRRRATLAGVVFDAETRNRKFAPQPDGARQFVEHVGPVVATVNALGITTFGPGSTHSDGDDYFRILQNLQRHGQAIAVPSIHLYMDKGMNQAVRRLKLVEQHLRRLGYRQAAITEGGVHGEYVAALDGFRWPWEGKPQPSRSRQAERADVYLRRLDEIGTAFWRHAYWYQVTDRPGRLADFGLFTEFWKPKPVASLFGAQP